MAQKFILSTIKQIWLQCSTYKKSLQTENGPQFILKLSSELTRKNYQQMVTVHLA